jgi:eukaryotic-like serine/threonine-protein kinase
MRRFFRYVLMTMVLVVVGLMSALTSMRIAIHGRETSIPNFTKLSIPEAERLAMSNGLAVAIEGQFYSSDIPEGRIVSQVPDPGTRVRRGWRVHLAQSLGPQRVVIPDVIGQSPRAAELNVRQRGLELGTVAEVHLPDTPTEEIIAQTPPPFAQGVQSPKVSVLLAVEPGPQEFVMPNFVGRSLAEATARIEQAGFKLAHVSTATTPPPPTTSSVAPVPSVTPSPNNSIVTPTTVIHQTPAAGQKVTPDVPIELEVNRLP